MSWVFVYRGNLEAALEQAQHAIAVNSNDSGAYVAKGNALLYSGRPGDARGSLLAAIRLNPRDPFGAVASMNLVVGHYFERNYVMAVEAAERTIRAYPNVPNTYRWLAAALGQQVGPGTERRRCAMQSIFLPRVSNSSRNIAPRGSGRKITSTYLRGSARLDGADDSLGA